MTNSTTSRELLEQAIKDSGLKKVYIAKQIGVSNAGLANLLRGRSEFRESQMQKLCQLLNLNEEQRTAIFFATNGA